MEEGTPCVFNSVEQNCLIFAGQNIRHIPNPWAAVSRMLPKSSGLWDWAFGCVPGAAYCIPPWMDLNFYFFCHSLHLGFTFPTTLYSSFSLSLVIWNCCSRGTTFRVEESQELLFVHPWTHFTDGLLLFQYKWVFYSLFPCLEPRTKSNLGQGTKK